MVRRLGSRLGSGSRLALAMALAVASLGVVAAGAGAEAADAPGVTDTSIEVGFIFSETGVASSSFKNTGKAFQARIDRQNARGGVHGRKIQTEIVDDQSANNLTAARDLVENRNVFVLVNDSSFGFLTYRYLVEAGVPTIGGGFDGTYYSEPGNESIVSVLGNVSADPELTSMIFANAMKRKGATKVAALAYAASQSSTNAARALQKYAVPEAGMEAVYTNTSVDFGTADVGPLVLGIKNSGADAVHLPMVASTNIAVVTGLKQAGVQMKANILATGYGQELLDSPAADGLDENDLFFIQYKPADIKHRAVRQFRSDLKKYADYTGVPDYGQYQGYLAADLLVLGLQRAGENPTRQSFLDGLRSARTWDGAGLSCQPIDISLENYGKVPDQNCAYYAYVKDGKFVTAFNKKPIVGKLVGSPEAIAANAAKNLSGKAASTDGQRR